MAKIIKPGPKPEEQIARHDCRNCGATVEFERTDISYSPDWREQPFVRCPSCEAFISVGVLTWKRKPIDPPPDIHRKPT